jgi:hypothetical protein
MTEILDAEKAHLAQLLEAIQRCVYFLDAAIQKLPFPLHGSELENRKKDENLFETLSAFNERFSKLQDTLAAAMRHAYLLMGENANNFLKILAFYEKQEVVISIEQWQLLRTARNLAAHDYEIDYFQITQHFNTLYELTTILYSIADRFMDFCESQLAIKPTTPDFSNEFLVVIIKNRLFE